MTISLHLRRTAVAVLLALLAACAGREPEPPAVTAPAPPAEPAPQVFGPPQMIDTGEAWQCVTYARTIGEVQIFGDAWTWWEQAASLYQRGQAPRIGAVLVLKRRGNSLGHVAVVRQVLDSRLIVAEHANWLNRGEIQIDSRIQDVSPGNDWTAVRVWYVPGHSWGRTTYPAYGFIYPAQVAGL